MVASYLLFIGSGEPDLVAYVPGLGYLLLLVVKKWIVKLQCLFYPESTEHFFIRRGSFMRMFLGKGLSFVSLGLFLFFSPLTVVGQAEPVARVYSVKGAVESRPNETALWSELSKGDELFDGNEIRVGESSRVGLKLVTGKLLRLRANSYLKVGAPSEVNPGGKVKLVSGVVHLFSRQKGNSPAIDTRDVSAAIRGSEVVFEKRGDETKITVLEGEVALANDEGSLVIGKGEQGRSLKGGAPRRVLLAKPEASVQWALYFPALISLADLDAFFVQQDASAKRAWALVRSPRASLLREQINDRAVGAEALAYSIGLARLGRLGEALKLVERAQRIPEAKLCQAQFFLATGNVDGANESLNEVKGFTAPVQAVRAIIAVVTNDLKRAWELAHVATAGSNPSVIALIARSYVHQALRQYDEAQTWVQKALIHESGNSFARARLAEFQLGQGDPHAALRTLSEVAEEDAQTRSVRGFTYLTMGRVEDAQIEFNRALADDSELGSPHLGLGLALIRQGFLAEGRAEFELAVHLEPSRGVFRSYLGKAFFEQELEENAEVEYQRAIDLDPDDPTPYLYRAFNDLSRNLLVPALKDIESAVARNDNRAIYRSKNLLDEDSSVQSTSLAEVYQQLGFSRVGQLEAMHSINKKYTNFGAHRLLGQSYEGDFYSETQFTAATVADILAPLSLNVFQGLSGYSSQASLNEYTALFDRDQHRTGLTGAWYSQDDEISGNLFQTGRMGDFGYFGGYRTLYARGDKSDGDFVRMQRLDVAGQFQPSHEHRFIATYGYTRDEQSQPQVGDDFEDVEASIASHHDLGLFELISRFEYFRRRQDGFDRLSGRVVSQSAIVDAIFRPIDQSIVTVDSNFNVDYDTYGAALQMLGDYGRFSWILGSDISYTELDARDVGFVANDPLGIYAGQTARVDSMSSSNLVSHVDYLYTTTELAPWADLNLGISYAQVELPGFDVLAPFTGRDAEDSLVAPKVGLTLRDGGLTLRSAYFRNLGVSNLSSRVAIEPVLVGSFSQRLGDLPGAVTENMGIGVDYKLPAKRYFGVEYLYRDISREVQDYLTEVQYDFDSLVERINYTGSKEREQENEHVVRAYSYHVLNEETTAAADYGYWRLEDNSLGSLNEYHRASLALNYFSPARWFAFFTPAWRQQDLRNRVGFVDGSESFWTLDLGAGYRFPKRHGSVRVVLRNIADQDFMYEDRGREAPMYSGINGAIEVSLNF